MCLSSWPGSDEAGSCARGSLAEWPPEWVFGPQGVLEKISIEDSRQNSETRKLVMLEHWGDLKTTWIAVSGVLHLLLEHSIPSAVAVVAVQVVQKDGHHQRPDISSVSGQHLQCLAL